MRTEQKAAMGAGRKMLNSRTLGIVAAGVILCSCRPQPSALGPEALEPVDIATVQQWLSGLAPTTHTRYDLRWTFQTQRGAVRGQAALRLSPPDSLRFDYRGPFGRSGAAFLVDDELVWAEPEEEVETLIQTVPMFWAALGMPRQPPPGSEILGVETESSRRWMHGVAGDTVEYMVTKAPPFKLQASMRQFDDVLGRVEVDYDEQSNLPVKATLIFPSTASVFILDVASIDTAVTLSADVWKRP